MKRFLTLLMMFCIMLFTSVTAIGDGVPKIYCDTIQCNSGETVSFSVHISDNTGMSAFLISIGCESDWLYFEDSAEQGDFTSKGSIETSGDARQINVLWYDVEGVSDDGTLFNVNVHISPSAPSGDYPIEIIYSPENTLDKELNQLELETTTGYITVTHIDVKNVADIVTSSEENNSTVDSNVKLFVGILAVAVVALVAIIVVIKIRKENQNNT